MIILYLLYQRRIWMDNKVRWSNLAHAKVTDDMLDAAFSSFILEIVARHGEPAPRLCNKDPNSFRSLKYLSQLFPNAKFILMIRDGRGVVHSIFSRNYSVDGYDPKNPRAALEDWNSRISEMDEQCTAVGERCFRMYYEQLVLHPELNMRKVLKFLDLPWNKSVLDHETFIGTEISLSKYVFEFPAETLLPSIKRTAPLNSAPSITPEATFLCRNWQKSSSRRSAIHEATPVLPVRRVRIPQWPKFFDF